MLDGLPVLVVDRDAGCTKLLAVLLRGEGCDVRTAASAEEALAAVVSFQPWLVLTELLLPQMSGIQLAQRLKANAGDRDRVLIAVTAMNGPETERLALAAGFTAYILKPIDAMTFTSRLAGYLGGNG